jgi:hypothetical protein
MRRKQEQYAKTALLLHANDGLELWRDRENI